jgi:hypothetical protein
MSRGFITFSYWKKCLPEVVANHNELLVDLREKRGIEFFFTSRDYSIVVF